jgi:hypothetical protein
MDIHVVADSHGPFNLLQSFLNNQNYQLHVFELLPAFYCNPMLRNLYLYHDRQTFNLALEQMAKGDAAAKSAVEDYERIHRANHCRTNADKTLIEFVEGHHNILKFHKERGYIPKLVPPKGCDQQARAFRRRIGEDKFIVATQFRIGRLTSERAEEADPNLDARVTFGAWYDFMKVVERKFPDVRFLMLGKLPDMPVMCLRLKNVIVPRLCGMNLGHELALIQMSDLFIGAASGFAGMAWFGEVPYVITGMQNEGWSWVGYDFGIERFPYANENQHIAFESESVPMLLKHFGRYYQEWKKGSHHLEIKQSQEEIVRTAFLFGTENELKKELQEYVVKKVTAANAHADANQAGSTLAALEIIGDEYSEIANEMGIFHLTKAVALYHVQRFKEAKVSALRALELEPSNDSAANLNRIIDAALK